MRPPKLPPERGPASATTGAQRDEQHQHNQAEDGRQSRPNGATSRVHDRPEVYAAQGAGAIDAFPTSAHERAPPVYTCARRRCFDSSSKYWRSAGSASTRRRK